MKKLSSPPSAKGGDTANAFKRLRLHIMIVPTVLIFAVLSIMFALAWTTEYQTRVDTIANKMSLTVFLEENGGEETALGDSNLFSDFLEPDPYVFGYRDDGRTSGRPDNRPSNIVDSLHSNTVDENSETSQENAKPRTLGDDATRGWEDYVPVIVYRIDYDAQALTPISGSDFTLTESAWQYANENLVGAPYGFGRMEQGSLFYQKSQMRNYDVIAFTDASALASRMDSLRDTFIIIVFLVSAITAVLAWLLSARLVKPLRESWTKQRRFIADASHELKTPIAVIIANSSIILDGHPDEEGVRKWTQATQEEAEKLNDLVADMLYLAANDAEKEVVMSEFNYSKVVMKLAMASESRAFEKGCTVSYDGIEKGLMAYGEETSLTRLASILIDNACKYCHDNTEIEVTLTADRKHLILSVADDGDELSQEVLGSLFDRFFRADKSRTGDNGYGLGLAMAKDITERHGGTIGVVSNEGHTVFTAKLPRKTSWKAESAS